MVVDGFSGVHRSLQCVVGGDPCTKGWTPQSFTNIFLPSTPWKKNEKSKFFQLLLKLKEYSKSGYCPSMYVRSSSLTTPPPFWSTNLRSPGSVLSLYCLGAASISA